MKDGRSIEIGVIGIEGFTSPHTLFGLNKAATDAIVQIPGEAFRIRRADLMRFMAEDAFLRNTLEKYAHFAHSAIAQTAACNRLHSLEARCCRWLLISHDSTRSDTFQLTHEFLAMMLGVQRSGVSVAANFLQKSGLIRYLHGKMTITNRAGTRKSDVRMLCRNAKGIRRPHPGTAKRWSITALPGLCFGPSLTRHNV